jgi:hypothetical protein
VPTNPPLQAFPTTFPADAAAKIGQAILSKSFGKDLIEPIYDLSGYFLGLIFGSTTPFPKPALSFAATYGDDDAAYAQVGHMLVGAANAHQVGVAPSASDRDRVSAGLVSQAQADELRLAQVIESLPAPLIVQVLRSIEAAIKDSEQPAPAE